MVVSFSIFEQCFMAFPHPIPSLDYFLLPPSMEQKFGPPQHLTLLTCGGGTLGRSRDFRRGMREECGSQTWSAASGDQTPAVRMRCGCDAKELSPIYLSHPLRHSPHAPLDPPGPELWDLLPFFFPMDSSMTPYPSFMPKSM